MPDQPAIHIRTMRLRVPGTSPDAGQALADALRTELARLPATHSAHFGAMNLRMPAPAPHDAAALPAAITTNLARHLTSAASARHA